MIRVGIADDHPVVREGLKRILAECHDIEVIVEADDADGAVAACKSDKPDVLVMDLSMPGPGFPETLRRVRDAAPDVKVLVLSVHPEEHYASRTLEAGAAGYLTKDRSLDVLAHAIRAVDSGERYLSDSAASRAEKKAPHETLSPREFEIFLLLGYGKTVRGIADLLNLSPKTVSTHRARILEKTDLAGNSAIIRYVVERDLLE